MPHAVCRPVAFRCPCRGYVLQLVGQVVDRVEVFLDREPTSRSNVSRVSLQDSSRSQTGLPCSAVRTGPIQAKKSLAAVKLKPMVIAERVDVVDELGGDIDVS